jgi:hypothetical protein
VAPQSAKAGTAEKMRKARITVLCVMSFKIECSLNRVVDFVFSNCFIINQGKENWEGQVSWAVAQG